MEHSGNRGGEGHYTPGISQGGLFGAPEKPKLHKMTQKELKESGLRQIEYRTEPPESTDTPEADEVVRPPKRRLERRFDGDSEDVLLPPS